MESDSAQTDDLNILELRLKSILSLAKMDADFDFDLKKLSKDDLAVVIDYLGYVVSFKLSEGGVNSLTQDGMHSLLLSYVL